MMASTREVLGEALRVNVAEDVLGKLPNDSKGKPRHRSATEGIKEGHKEPSGSGTEKTSRLLREIEGLRARVARRDETISKLQDQAKHHVSSRELEAKVNDLIARQQASKGEHRQALEKLSTTNAPFEKEAEAQRTKEASLVAKLADTRAKLALSEAEHSKTRQELAKRPAPTSGPAVDERLAWKKEKATAENEMKKVEKEVSRWMKRCEQLQVDSQKYAGMGEENERLRYGAGVMAEQYAELFEAFGNLKLDADERISKSNRIRQSLEAELKELRELNSEGMEERDGLADQLDFARHHIAILKEALNEAMSAKRDAEHADRIPLVSEDDFTSLEPVASLQDVHTILDLSITHSSLGQAALVDSHEHLMSLTTTIIELEASVRQAEQSLSSVQLSLVGLKAEHETLGGEHAPCGATMSQLRFELNQANEVADNRGEEINEVRLRLCKSDERSERHADLLKKANDDLNRAKFAQDSLEEEVEHLRTKFLEAAGFEDQYYELLERQEILECRESIAIEQAERVAMENAELMGHPDGSSRIGYVDGVRREMAMCRQELASTRHRLNNANTRIASLENEISAYKSISSEAAAGNLRTRVVRRQPEGGRLTASVSASGPRRLSVSGPGGARRFV